jgi:hypothetical protein
MPVAILARLLRKSGGRYSARGGYGGRVSYPKITTNGKLSTCRRAYVDYS